MPLRDTSPVLPPPLRVLCVFPNPSDLSRVDVAGLWQEISISLQPLTTQGAVVLEQLAEPTETRLKSSLAQASWHVLHLVVHGRERGAANYGTLALNSSDGRARDVTAAYVAALVAGSASTKLVVLQAADEASRGFQVVSKAMTDQGLTVITAPPLSGRAVRIFASKLYNALLANLNADEVLHEVSSGLSGEGLGGDAVGMSSQDSASPIFAVAQPQTGTATVAAPAVPRPPAASPAPAGSTDDAWREALERKRISGQFDVFLCHNSADKPAVKRIAQRLKEAAILPWLDVWELPPGLPWQPLLERQIGNIKSAAVFVGSAGIGPWQQQELDAFLRAFVKRKIPVIPVMLPDAPSQPDLPAFLEGLTWVDFRAKDPDPLAMLIWGITGKRPED